MRSERHRTKKRCRSPIVRRVSVLLLTAMVLMLYTFSEFSAFAESPQADAQAEQQTEQMMEASSGQEAAQTDVSNQIQQASGESGDEEASATEEQSVSASETEQKDSASDETASDEVKSDEEKSDEGKTDEAKSDEEKADETSEKEEMPAQHFSGSASNGVAVSASVSEGVFPKGTEMTVSAVSDSVARNAAEKAASEDAVVSDAVGVDISFSNRDGEEIEPADGQQVAVTLSLDAQLHGETFRVLHQSDSGDVSVVSGSAQAEGAKFSAESFSIYVISGEGSEKNPAIGTYQFHNSDGTILDTQKVKNGETLYAPETPEKSGYIFRGWSKDPEEKTVDFGTEKSWTASVSGTETIDLYPVFEEKHYVFFYDSNGDDGRIFLTREGVKGERIETSDVILPISSDEAVTGWYLDKDLTKKVDQVELSEENVMLYPKIERGHYITFESGTGASYIPPQFVSASGKTVKPENPTRPGYTFAGWYADETGDTKYEFGNGLPGDLKLYARWTPKEDVTYRVIHWQQNANDNNYSYKESEELSGTAGRETKAEKKKYPGFYLKDNTINQETIHGDGSTIVNVYYDREKYSVTFWKSELVEHWLYNEWKWKELKEYRITARYGADIFSQWPKDVSKIWGTKKGEDNGGPPYQSGISTMPLGGDDFYYVSQNGRNTYNLNYYLEGLDGKYTLDHTDSFKSDGRGWKTTKEDHYDINGFTYTNNVKDGSSFGYAGVGHTYEVNFNYSRNSYDINFINGDEKTSRAFKYGADISQAGFEPERPTGVPAAYEFGGWYDNKDYAGDPFSFQGRTMPADNITLYAKWAAPKYKVTVHKVDGTVSQTFDADYGSTITRDQVKDVVIPEGSKWIGWAVKNGENYTVFNFDTKIHGDLDLYPYYLSTERYTVTYDVNGGKGSVTDPKYYSKDARADIQEGTEITPPQGKVFLNWNTKADGTGTTYYPGDRVAVGGNLTLYAQYGETSKTTTLVYKANYPAGSSDTPPSDILQTVNGKTDLSNNTEFSLQSGAIFKAPEGYYFTGWKDGNGNSFHAGDSVVVDNTTENVLYAQWEKKQELKIQVTGHSDTVIYDGTERSVSGYDVTYRLGDQLLTSLPAGLVMNCPEKAKAAGTNVNTYSMGLTDRDFGITGEMAGHYIITVQVADGSLTITPKKLTLTGESGNVEYDGNPHTLDGITPEGLLSGHELKGITYAAAGTDAGTYDGTFDGEAKVMAGNADVTKNYDITKTPGKLTISKQQEATVTIRGSKEEKTYTGEKQSVKGFQVEGPKDISVKLKSGKTAEAAGTDAGTYQMNLKEDDFDVTSGNYEKINVVVEDGKLTIKKKALTLNGESGTVEYDGNPHTLKVITPEGLISGHELTGIKYAASGTDAGTYEGEFTGEAKVMAGDTDVTKNYNITKTPGTLTIKKQNKEVTVTIRGNAEEKTYTGKEQHAEGFQVEGPKDISVKLKSGKTAEAAGTDAGTYHMNLKADDFDVTSGNYEKINVVVEDGSLRINPKALTLTGESGTVEYDGNPHTLKGITPDGLLSGHELKGITYAASGTDAGTYEGKFTGEAKVMAGDADVTKNYNITKTPGKLTISKQNEATVTIRGNVEEKTYTGEKQGVKGFKVEGPKDISVELKSGKTAEAAGTDAGTYQMNLKEDDFDVTSGNYEKINVVVEDGKLTIKKKALTLNGESGTVEYDGNPHTLKGITPDGLISGHELKGITYAAAGTDAGTYNGTFKGEAKVMAGDADVTKNYNITKTPGKLTIKKQNQEVTVTIRGNAEEKTYTGEKQSVEGFQVEGPKDISVELKSGKTAEAAGTDAGTYPMNLKADDFDVTSGNYEKINVVVEDGSLRINPKALTLTGESGTVEYDGNPHTLKGITPDGLISGHELKGITYAAAGTDAGTYNGTFNGEAKVMAGDTDVTKNYEISKVPGTLTITPKIYPNDPTPVEQHTLTYDGNGGTTTSGAGIYLDPKSPYMSNATVVVLPNIFTYSVPKNGKYADAESTDSVIRTAVFDGWNTAKDGSGTAYQAGDTFRIHSSVTLYAQWKTADNPVDPSKPDKPNKPSKPDKPTKPDKPAKPNGPAKPAEPAKPNGAAGQTSVVKTDGQHPRTGDETELPLYAGGFASAAAALILLRFLKRKRRGEEK